MHNRVQKNVGQGNAIPDEKSEYRIARQAKNVRKKRIRIEKSIAKRFYNACRPTSMVGLC